jgi:hypothetical protein
MYCSMLLSVAGRLSRDDVKAEAAMYVPGSFSWGLLGRILVDIDEPY